MYEQYKMPIYSIITGMIITLLTGFFPNVFILGIKHWGYLLPWSVQTSYPDSPFEILWINLIADIIIWSVLIYLTLVSAEEEEKKRSAKKTLTKKKSKRKR